MMSYNDLAHTTKCTSAASDRYRAQLKRVRTREGAAKLIRAWACGLAAVSTAPADQVLGVIREAERQASLLEREPDDTKVTRWLATWGYR